MDVSGKKYAPGCLQGNPRIIVPQKSEKDEPPFAIFNKTVDGFGEDSGTGQTPRGLDAAYRALTPPSSIDENCNKVMKQREKEASEVFS